MLVSTTELDPAAFVRAVARGDYDLALAERRTPVADRAFLLRRFACTPRGYCNPAADAAVAGSLAQSPEAAAAALSQAEAAMLADVPMIPLARPGALGAGRARPFRLGGQSGGRASARAVGDGRRRGAALNRCICLWTEPPFRAAHSARPEGENDDERLQGCGERPC